jgi:succinate dehydrogenase / fumarate reductase iron-sulfur subunit
MQGKETVILKIYRGEPENQYFEEFELPRASGLNVISALMEIRKKPVNRDGKKTSPVAWESGCLEEVCGSCSMLINGRPRQSCSAIIENIIKETKNSVITLAPFTKFPLLKDLIVNRQKMFDNLKKVKAWVPVDRIYAHNYGPEIPPVKQEVMYKASTCMTCACCSEACPQVNGQSEFIGPAPISQVKLFNMHPTGKNLKASRLKALMQEGGISECGNAQNCHQVCPKKIPLTEAIADVGGQVSRQIFKDLFSLPEC